MTATSAMRVMVVNNTFRHRGPRVTDLRRLLVKTQQELSADTGIAQSNLSDIERGVTELTDTNVQRICNATRVPLEFFNFSTPGYTGTDIHFRKAAGVSAKGRDFVIQAFKEVERIAIDLADAPTRLSRLPVQAAEATDIVNHDDIELYALDVRRALGLASDEPVRNVTRMLERTGVAVAPLSSMPGSSESLVEGHCGMSRWDPHAPRAVVAYVDGMPGDRQRFTLAHEFGHVLLHTRREPAADVRAREAEADQFAGALLLPEPVASKHISESLTLHGYMRVKAAYGISIQAIITRGHRLGLISRERQRSLMIQLSSRGWRKSEPVVVRNETPLLMWTELTAIHGQSPYFSASQKLGVPPRFLEQWIPTREVRSRRSPPAGGDVIAFESLQR